MKKKRLTWANAQPLDIWERMKFKDIVFCFLLLTCLFRLSKCESDNEDGSEGEGPPHSWSFCEGGVLFGVIVASGVGTALMAPLILCLLGFTAAGVRAGSLAACAMATQGGVIVEGGIIATMQSAGAAGCSVAGRLTLGIIGAVLGGVICAYSPLPPWACREAVGKCFSCDEGNSTLIESAVDKVFI